jgi:hypothetical protein
VRCGAGRPNAQTTPSIIVDGKRSFMAACMGRVSRTRPLQHPEAQRPQRRASAEESAASIRGRCGSRAAPPRPRAPNGPRRCTWIHLQPTPLFHPATPWHLSPRVCDQTTSPDERGRKAHGAGPPPGSAEKETRRTSVPKIL